MDSMTERIAREMGFDESGCSDLGICVTEAVNNAIMHAHNERADLSIDVVFERSEGALQVIVRDHGSGFDEASLPDPTLPQNLMKTGGRGIHVIRALMDSVSIERLNDGMKLSMLKKLTQ